MTNDEISAICFRKGAVSPAHRRRFQKACFLKTINELMRSDFNPELLYATFWQRLTAFMLDIFFVVLPVTFIMLFFLPLFIDINAIQKSENKEFETIYQFLKHGIFVFLTGYAAISLILALFTTSRWQATPGKRVVNLYIARRNGDKVNFKDAFMRFYFLPLLILTIQVFKRQETYTAIDNMKASGNLVTDLTKLETHLNGPVTHITNLIVLFVIMVWFMKIFFSKERAAMHDTLFNTRVFQGKK